MADPRQVFSNQLEAVKGWFDMNALDKQAKISANVTFSPVYAGRCMHLNADEEFETGCLGNDMPIFLLKNSDNPSVANEGGGQTLTGWVPVMPRGTINGLVGKGAYELETTEYNTALTYAIGEPLRAVAANTTAATGGTLTNASVVKVQSATPQLATAIVGHVSKKVYKCQSDRPARLPFWPGHYPGAAGL